MTHTKQIRLLDELVSKMGDTLKLVIYDYWMNELDEHPDEPHYEDERFPMSGRYNFPFAATGGNKNALLEKYSTNIYRKLTVKELVDIFRDPTSEVSLNFQASSGFREFYDLLNSDNVYCLEINLPESFEIFKKNYEEKHPNITYDDAIKSKKHSYRNTLSYLCNYGYTSCMGALRRLYF